MNEPVAFLNGHRLPQSHARLALHDAGFVLGATVTDLCRTFRHRLDRWSEHLARFRASCQTAYIDLAISADAITQHAFDIVEHNARLIGADDDLALVLFATPGPIGYYLGDAMAAGEQPTLGMHTFPLPFARYRPWIEDGAVLATPSVRAVPRECVPPQIKQRSRMHWWLADREAQRVQPGSQALLLDQCGHVTETAAANLVIVKNGQLISPPAEDVLDGVSLRVVIDICKRLGIEFARTKLTPADCYAADEALLTSTGFCIAGVRQINDRKIPWPGPMLKALMSEWNSAVGIDIQAQIKMDHERTKD